jgi:hypothetical protein
MRQDDDHRGRRSARELAEGHLRPPAAAALPLVHPREHLWSPSYFAASASGARWETLKAYIRQQRFPARPGTNPAPNGRAARGRPAGGQRLCELGGGLLVPGRRGRGRGAGPPGGGAVGLCRRGGHGHGRHRPGHRRLPGRHGPGRSAWASIASSFEPVFTVALGVVVLGDRLSPGKVVGGLAVVAGAVLLPLLGGAREAVGSSLQPEYTPTRGSTRR